MIIILELNKIHNIDVLSGLKEIPDNSINCIITSPPYNKVGLRNGKKTSGKMWSNCGGNINYDVFDDNMDEEYYKNWQISILNECCRILKPDGSMFYNHKVRRYNNKAYFPHFALESNFKFYQMIIWNRKSNCDSNIKYMSPTTELIFWLTKDKPKVFKNQCDFKNEIWDISPKPNKHHPASFPIEIPDNCIKLTTEPKDIVLDPFAGSGTTLISAKNLNRNYMGLEISKNYCDYIHKSLNEYIK